MDCEQIETQIDAAPGEDFPGRDEHLAGCDACRERLAAAMAFEQKLQSAMRVDVPELQMPGLRADVVSLAAKRPPRLGRSSGLWLAAAASVMLAVVIGVRLINVPADNLADEQLVAELLEHMSHEPYSRVVTNDAVPMQQVLSVTGRAKAEVSADIGLISYARSCEVNGKSIPHLVVQGNAGPVTIMIMSDQPISDTVSVQDEFFEGVIVPVGDSGSVAIIGRKGESIEDVQSRIDDAIRWSI